MTLESIEMYGCVTVWMSMDDGPYWVILLMYESHEMRHTGFSQVDGGQRDLGSWRHKFEDVEYKDINLTDDLVQVSNRISYFMINIKEEQIQSLIDRLEKLEIIAENVLKYWEKDKVQCILKIKNLDYKIKTTKIEAIEKDREDYKTCINDLLKLDIIRISYSPHRSVVFLVNKHSEQKRGKSRMVINYKRLNDNTEDDEYDIPTKEYLLGKIKDCTTFSKFDCKSGFWQVKMHLDSIPWTDFSCPEGHFE